MALKVGELFATIGLDTTQFDKAIKDSEGLLESFGKKMSLAASAAALWSTGKQVVQTAVDYETAFAGVRKTVEATEEEYAALSAQIIEMSKIKPISASSIAGIAEIAGQLGVAKEDVLDFTEIMIDLGESTNLSSEDAASALAKFAAITGMQGSLYDRLGASIVALGNNFATTEADIVNMGLRIAGTGNAVGMSEAQIMAFSAAMSSVGLTAEAGGGSMSRFITMLQNAVSAGGDDLTAFANVAGMTADEFSQAFKTDSAAAILEFVKGLSESEDLIGTITGLDINETEMQRMLTGLAGGADLLAEALALSSTAWAENTALTEEAAKRYETTASQFQILENKITALGQKFGDALLGPVNAVVDTLSGWLDEIISTVEWVQKELGFRGGMAATTDAGEINWNKYINPYPQRATPEAVELLKNTFNMSEADVKALGIDELRAKIEEALAKTGGIGTNAGQDLVDGFAFSIENGAGRVRSAAQTLASAAESGLQTGIDAHSPSRLSGQYGTWWVEGFADKILSGSRIAAKASATMAKAAAAGLSISPLRGVSTFANSYARSEQNGLAGLIPALADAMAQRPANMYAKGRLIAQTLAPENQSAINQRSSRIAFGYGGR